MPVAALSAEEFSGSDFSFSSTRLRRQLADQLLEHARARLEIRVLLSRDGGPGSLVRGGLIVPVTSSQIIAAVWPIADSLTVEDQLLEAYARMAAGMSPPRTATLLSPLDVARGQQEQRRAFRPLTAIRRYRQSELCSSTPSCGGEVLSENCSPRDESVLKLLKITEINSQDLPEFLPLMDWRERLDDFQTTAPDVNLSINRFTAAERAVGIAVWSLNSVTRECEVHYVGIPPALRGRGWGSQLLLEVCRIARERGADSIVLNVDSRNRVAIKIYESVGFRKEDCRRLWISRGSGLFSTGSTHDAPNAPVF